jgi:cyclophilin family peptidyl-prolyl cis-trans isomerase
MQSTRRILVALFSAAALVPATALAQDKPGACAAKLKDAKTLNVKLTTSLGPISLALDAEKAPITVANFASYVDAGHYSGTIFHRVIASFMIQGGGFTKDYVQKPMRASIKNEGDNGLKNDAYTIAMARTPDPNSATSQFFINVKNNDGLNTAPGAPGYAVFGKVTSGQDTVDKIKVTPTGPGGPFPTDAPRTQVVIEKAECL